MQQQATETAVKTEDSDSVLLITGGTIIVNADGDGLDSNEDIKMTGGTVTVYGPTNSGNGSLDYDGTFTFTFTLTGGTLVAAGSVGMAMGVSDTSTQNTIMMTFTDVQQADTTVTLETADGEVLVTTTPVKQFQTIVLSAEGLEQGQDYQIHAGDDLVTFTLPEQVMTYVDATGITEASGHMMMPDGGGFGGRGNQENDRERQTPPDQTN